MFSQHKQWFIIFLGMIIYNNFFFVSVSQVGSSSTSSLGMCLLLISNETNFSAWLAIRWPSHIQGASVEYLLKRSPLNIQHVYKKPSENFWTTYRDNISDCISLTAVSRPCQLLKHKPYDTNLKNIQCLPVGVSIEWNPIHRKNFISLGTNKWKSIRTETWRFATEGKYFKAVKVSYSVK